METVFNYHTSPKGQLTHFEAFKQMDLYVYDCFISASFF